MTDLLGLAGLSFTVGVPLSLLTVHFVADFVLQNDWMALGKSKRLLPLTAHVLVYATPFFWWGWKFAVVTFALHWITDFVTSRLNASLYQHGVSIGSYHWFFIGIGADQLAHFYALAYTYHWLAT